jgi:hypothetical protein
MVGKGLQSGIWGIWKYHTPSPCTMRLAWAGAVAGESLTRSGALQSSQGFLLRSLAHQRSMDRKSPLAVDHDGRGIMMDDGIGSGHHRGVSQGGWRVRNEAGGDVLRE